MKDSDLQIVSTDPFDQFISWYEPVINSGAENYNAFALSTSTLTGSVSSRIVLLKQFDKKGFVFYTNYNSRKGRQINENPVGAMLFYWPDFKRQVRIEGDISRTSAEESDEYFNSRKPGHKINAIASNQSELLKSRKLLIKKVAELKTKYKDNAPERPDYWGGFRLVPTMFEFWQEGADRFHDRIEYTYQGGLWKINRLSP